MKPLHIETPLFESPAMASGTGKRIWLKLETAQPPGSFKIRGVGLACQTYVRRGATRLLSSSGGNAGIAVAYAGRHLSVPVLVVVPETTTERAKTLILQEGAQVVVHGRSWQEAHAHALSMVRGSDAFLHPFDDPLIWSGHASLVDEVARLDTKPDVVVVSVGGGGLLCGVVEGLHRNRWSDVPVMAVETEGADSFARSIDVGRRVMLPAITSVATSLGARQVCRRAFAWSKQHPVRSVVVTDRAAVSACERFLVDHRVLVEPACGASLAIVYDGARELEPYASVLVVVCGGVTTTLDQLRAWSSAAESGGQAY